MMGNLIQTIRQKIQKLYHEQIRILRIHVQVVPTVAPFVLIVPDQIDKVQIQTEIKIKTKETQTTTIGTITIRTIDTKLVAINKTTDKITIAIHQTSNKTEITQTNNHIGIVTEQTTSIGIFKHVLIAEDWDICLANVEHQDKIKTIGNKTRMLTKIRKNTSKTATQIPPSNKIL